MDPDQARKVLGVSPQAPWGEVRRAYRDRIRAHHPDRVGQDGLADAVVIIEAFGVLDQARRTAPNRPSVAPMSTEEPRGRTGGDPDRSDHGFVQPGPAEAPGSAWSIPLDPAGPPVHIRVDSDTIRLLAPPDETFRWLLEAAHQIGHITYLDRSGPLFEVLCQFLHQPATSLLVTLQGRSDGTDALCSAESIEARPGPATVHVVDVLEDALSALRPTTGQG